MTTAEQLIERAALGTDPLIAHLRKLLKNDPATFVQMRELKMAARARSKGATAAAATDVGNWGEPLGTPGLAAVVNLIRERSVLGRMGVLQVPPAAQVVVPGTGASAAFVGGGQAKIVATFGYELEKLVPKPLAVISAMGRELILANGPAAENAVRAQLTAGVARGLDSAFLNPSNTGEAGVSPASITAGATNFASNGSGAAGALADLTAALAALTNGGARLDGGIAIVASLANCIVMAAALGPAVAEMLPGRVRLIPSDAAGTNVVFGVPGMMLYAGADSVIIDASENASIEMATDPTHDSSTPSETTLVSMFQTNSVALRAEIFIDWAAADGSVAYATGADYGAPAAS